MAIIPVIWIEGEHLENLGGSSRSILRTLFIALYAHIGTPTYQWRMRQFQNQASNENVISYEAEPKMG